MKKALKHGMIFGAVLCLHAIVYLAVTGVPEPRAITAESVKRVAWSALFEDARKLWDARSSAALVGLMPDGSGLLLEGRHLLFESRVHRISGPGASPELLSRVPRNASVYSRLGRDYIVLGMDRDGDEQFALYRWDLNDSEPELLTSGEERALFGAFEPDGHRFAYSSTRRNGADHDIYVMDPRDPGTDRMVLEPGGMWVVGGWSPTADVLLLARVTSSLENQLHLFDLETRELRVVTPEPETPTRHGAPRWSRDGRFLFYASDRGTEFSHARRLDLETGREIVLSEEIPWDVLAIQQTHDGNTLLLSVNEDGRTAHYAGENDGTAFKRIELFETGEYGIVAHPEEPVLIVNHVDSRGRSRGYTYDMESRKLTLWAGADVTESDVPTPRLVRYATFDSVDGGPRQIPAFVYPGVGEGPRPVLINIHGGPEGQSRLGTAEGTQRAGITMIAPNVRGSTGYGRTYTELGDPVE